MELTKSVDAPSASPFNALITMFYEPARTFASLEDRKAGWLPTILIIIGSLINAIWYFNTVDFAWLQDQMLADVPAPEQELVKEFMGKGVLMTITVLGTIVGLPGILTLTALYFIVVSKAMKKPVDFNTSFSVAAWAAWPMILTVPLGIIQILMSSNGQMDFSALNPLSLNQLIFHYEMSHPLATFYDSVSVMTVWNIFLLVIGYEAWAKVPRATAWKVVLVPYATIYGLWFALAMALFA